jgi:hypothetical protein
MPHSEINEPIRRLPNGDLFVTGPIRGTEMPGFELVPPVVVRFMIVQSQDDRPDLIADEVTLWTGGPEWDAIVPNHRAQGIGPGRVRAIGVAVFRWDKAPVDRSSPPALGTYTWCVTRNVVDVVSS